MQALKGVYVLEDCEGTPDVLLIGTGSEVELCVEAKAKLAESGVKARVVSMPCIEEFEKQTGEYKESVLPAAVKARVCVEAGSPYSWYKYAGEKGEIVGMSTFGASAPAPQLFEKFGFTAAESGFSFRGLWGDLSADWAFRALVTSSRMRPTALVAEKRRDFTKFRL